MEETNSTMHDRDVSAILDAIDSTDRAERVYRHAEQACNAAQARNETIARLAVEASEAHGLVRALWARLASEVARRKELKSQFRVQRAMLEMLRKTNDKLRLEIAHLSGLVGAREIDDVVAKVESISNGAASPVASEEVA